MPEQPYTGPPPPASERPYAAILAAKEKGASNEELLAKVESEHVPYSLTTPEIQKLRAAGVSGAVIEAMLRSGRAPTPGAATPVSYAALTRGGAAATRAARRRFHQSAASHTVGITASA